MRKNDAGLTILEKGDIVRIGKGKVTYTVFHDENRYGVVDIQSDNTGRVTSEHRNRLTLVRNVRDLFPEVFEPETLDNSTRALSEEDTEPVVETSAYAKAVLFALNKLRKHVYAGTVSEKTKGKRRSLGRRQKASRKANR